MKMIILLLGLLSAFGPLSIDMYLPAFPLIAQNFGVELSRVQLSLSSFLVGIALGQIFYGPLTDRFGRKKPLYAGLLIYCLASFCCALSVNAEQLIYFRFFQALGSCAGMVISRAVVRDLYRPQDAAKIFSLLMLIMGVAPILAPVLGGFVSSLFGWRAIFWILSLISALSFLLIHLYLKETHSEVVALNRKSIIKNYATILKDRAFLSNSLGLAFTNAGMFTYITGSSFVFVEYYGLSATHYSWIFGMNAAGIIAASQLNGFLLAKLKAATIIKTVFIYALVVSFSLFALGLVDPPMLLLCLGLFIYLPIIGIIGPNASALALSNQKKLAGSASALLGTIQFTVSGSMSALVSVFHDGTVRPMCTIIFISSLMAFLTHYFLKPRSTSDPLQVAPI